ncbi:MAG: hypothetical protein QOH88_1537 [Verrucomicrobiota bacterium]|jgi:hypothetical protein
MVDLLHQGRKGFLLHDTPAHGLDGNVALAILGQDALVSFAVAGSQAE